MTDHQPIACSLSAGDLQHRLEEIAALGATALIAREHKAGAHTLRFRHDEATETRLAEIVAAERRCCSFLALDLSERDGEIVLTIAAASDRQAAADGFAAAFG